MGVLFPYSLLTTSKVVGHSVDVPHVFLASFARHVP